MYKTLGYITNQNKGQETISKQMMAIGEKQETGTWPNRESKSRTPIGKTGTTIKPRNTNKLRKQIGEKQINKHDPNRRNRKQIKIGNHDSVRYEAT